jgi:hypothetical protein
MSNDWLRLWHDMPNDPKWRSIARASGKPIPAVISVYIHMLVCASNATERGRTHGWCDEDVANALDLSTDDVSAIREAMQDRVLDGDYLKGWEKRQPKREDGGADRAKAWREKKKLGEERARTRTNATEPKRTLDTDTEEDTDKKDPVVDAARVEEIFEWLQAFLNSPSPLFSSPIVAWLGWGADFHLDIRPVAERWRKVYPKKAIRSLEWLDDDIAASIKKRAKPMPETENSGGPNANTQRRATHFGGSSGGGTASKTDRARAAVMRAAVAGGYAPVGQPGEAGTGDDAVSVFPGAESLG